MKRIACPLTFDLWPQLEELLGKHGVLPLGWTQVTPRAGLRGLDLGWAAR